MKKLFIADIKSHTINGKSFGHYMPVARNYRDIFKNLLNVRIAGGPIYNKYFKDEELTNLPFNIVHDTGIEKIKTFINAIVLFFKARNNIIILQQSTPATAFLTIALFYWKTSRLFLIQYNSESLNSRLKRWIYNAAKWKIDGFIVPNQRIGELFGTDYCQVTDYINCSEKIDFIPYEERIWDFGIVGTIFKDKGSLEALQHLAESGHKVLIAGNVAEPELQAPLNSILSKYKNIESKIGFVSDEDFNYYIKYSKYCILNYSGTYFDRSSGLVLDIVFNGTPVIGSQCSALSLIDENKLGYLYDNLKNWDASQFLDKSRHASYLNNIRNYELKQKEYCRNLINFVCHE